jgi:tetratricopeptide (TPR) repeat protein
MKSLVFAAGIASLALTPSAASGAIMTLGGPLSKLCYEAAQVRDGRDASVDGCTRALQEEALAPTDRAATLVNRGILYMARHRDTEADMDFNQALAINDGLSDAWLNKGFLRLREGNGRDALPLLQKGMERGARRQALAVFARGVAYEQMGDFQAAYADLKRAHDLEPGWDLPRQFLADYRLSHR